MYIQQQNNLEKEKNMSTKTPHQPDEVRASVRDHYTQAARARDQGAGCCAPGSQSTCCGASSDQSSGLLQIYETPEAFQLPQEVSGLSMGCGDPITLAALQAGQTVLDLGSGGGIDCFLAAKKVGPQGLVIGVDMTPEMLERARANKARLQAHNVDFRLGEIEHLPVADRSVDVIISNCVINLSPDKPQVFREAFRVLKPGGRMAVSDIVTDGPLPEEIKQDLSAWAGCVAGAWQAKDYVAALQEAGFEDVQLTPVYFSKEMIAEAAEQIKQLDDVQVAAVDLEKAVFSARITTRKPA